MSTIILSPLGTTEEDSSEVIQLEVVVQDEDFVGLFDVVELWRSELGESGPYYEITAADNTPARIPKTSDDPPATPVTGPSVFIVGTSMLLKVNEATEVPITITGVDPLDFATIATSITSQGLNLIEAYVGSKGEMVVQTTQSGASAILRIVEGDAAAVLGLPLEEPDSLSYGKDIRVKLVPGQEVYTFTDPFSSNTYFYKTRFRNSSTGAVSEFSTAFGVGSAVGLNQDSLACGQLELVSGSGKPLKNVEVRLFTQFNGTLVDGKVVAGEDLIKATDNNGKVEFILVRGQKFTVSIVGTDLTREITVPTDTTIKQFNLLDPSVGTGEDVFKVQVPDIVYAERRTL